MSRVLEQQLAGRYLYRLHARPARMHLVTLLLVLVSLGGRLGLYLLARRHGMFLDPRSVLAELFHWISLGGLVGTVLVGFLLLLLWRLNVFSAISTYGLFLGSAALVLVLSVMSGFENDLKGKILGANAHVTVSSPDRAFTNWAAEEPKIHHALPSAKVSPFLSSEVMITSSGNMSGVVLKGIDPTRVGDVTDLSKNLEQGRMENLVHPGYLLGAAAERTADLPDEDDRRIIDSLEKSKALGDGKDFRPLDRHGAPIPPPPPPSARKIRPGVIVGRELAKNLRVYVGDEVSLVSPMGDIGPSGPIPKSKPFRVAGIFYSGMYEYDSKYVYLAIPEAQKFLGTGDEITGFEIRVGDPDRSEIAVEKLKRELGAGYEVQDWKELNRNLFSALRVEKISMFIVLCFIILVAGFSIVANGIMLVREKRRDIAILKAMGSTDGTVLRSFLYMGIFMGMFGVVCGIVVGVGACLLLNYFGLTLDTDVYYISKLPVRLNPWEIGAVFAAAMTIVLVATLYPALVAARLRPVDGLRYDQ